MKTPKILNILGLAVAIAAFMVVAMIRYYDLQYDKSYPGAERIYKLALWSKNNDGTCGRHASLTDKMSYHVCAGITPENVTRMPSNLPLDGLEDVCLIAVDRAGRVYAQDCPETDSVVLIQAATPSVFHFFGIKLQTGTLDNFEDSSNVVITSSLAEFLFPHSDAVGQQIVIKDAFEDDYSFTDTFTIAAVYKDLPQNTSMAKNGIIRCFKPREIENPGYMWGQLHGDIYYKLKKGCLSEAFAQQLFEMLQTARQSYMASKDTTGDSKLAWDEFQEKYKDAPPKCDSISLESLDKDHLYYSPMNGWIGEEHTVFISKMLGTFGIVLLLLAFLNFTNYAVATVPMFLRKTNIRKIEGCSNVQLRWEMFGRFLLSDVIAFLIALVIVEVCARTKVIPFLTLSLKLADNLPVVWISAAVTLLVAVVASLYPVFYTTTATNVESALKSQLATPQKYGKWRKVLFRLQTTPASVLQFFASFAIILFMTLVFVRNHQMKTADLGFETDNVYVSSFVAFDLDSTDEKSKIKTNLCLLQNLAESVSGVQEMCFALDPVLGHDMTQIEESSYFNDETGFYAILECKPVSSNFFDFFHIELVQGDAAKWPAKPLVNETAYKTNESIYPHKLFSSSKIAGVVRDFHNVQLTMEIDPCLYRAYTPNEYNMLRQQCYFYLKLKKDYNIQRVSEEISQKVESAGYECPLGPFQPLKLEIDKKYHDEDDFAKLMALFGAVTLFVTLTGLIGMVMLDCTYRRRELALRRVYGASTGNQLWKMIRNQLIISIITFAAATPLAVSLFHKWQQHFAYKADIPVWPFLATFLTVTLLALGITAWQTLRTLREEPDI